MFLKEITIEQFEYFLSTHNYNSIYQTSEYTLAMKNQGYMPMFLGLFDNGEIVAASAILIQNKNGFKYAQPAAALGSGNAGRPGADSGWRRLRQDPRPDLPRGEPDGARRGGVPYSGADVHQQGSEGNEGANRCAGGRSGE